MKQNAKPSELTALLAVAAPISKVGGNTLATPYIPVAVYGALLATILTGVIGATATVDAKIQQATDSAGTGVIDVAGKAITQLVGTDDGKAALINFKPGDLTEGFTHARLLITVGDTASPDAATALVAGLIQGFDARFAPVTQAAIVAQTV